MLFRSNKNKNKTKNKNVASVVPAPLGNNSDVENGSVISVTTVGQEGGGYELVRAGNARGGGLRSEHLSVDGLGENDGFSPSLDDTDPPAPPHPRTHTSSPNTDTDTSPTPSSSCIEDPWNGPRVLDVVAFLASPYAAPPSMSDEACRAHVAPEVCGLMQRALPEDNALVGVLD